MRARLLHQLHAMEDQDSWDAVSLKETLSMPEWKASVLAAEAETDAVQRSKGSEAGAAGALGRNKRGFVVSCLQSRAETSSDRTTAQKLAKCEHITGGSATKRTTGAMPTEVGVLPVVKVAAVGAPAAPSRHRDDFEIFRDVGPTRPLAASATGRVSTTTRPMTPREIERREKRSRFPYDDFLHQELLKRGGLEKLLRELPRKAFLGSTCVAAMTTSPARRKLTSRANIPNRLPRSPGKRSSSVSNPSNIAASTLSAET